MILGSSLLNVRMSGILLICSLYYTFGSISITSPLPSPTTHHDTNGEEDPAAAGGGADHHDDILPRIGVNKSGSIMLDGGVSEFLPTNATLFCTSFDNETYMWLIPEHPFARTVPKLTVAVPQCPAPVVLHEIVHYPSVLAVPPSLTTKQRRNYFKAAAPVRQKRSVAAADFTTATPHAASVLNVGKSYTWQTYIEPVSVSHHCGGSASSAKDTAHTCPSYTRSCVERCLASLCCTGIQILNNATHRRCDLIAARLDESMSVAPHPSTKRPLLLLAQRREFRPSLNADHLRLVVESGPRPATTLSRVGEHSVFSDGALISLALHGKFGELSNSEGDHRQLLAELVIVDDDAGIDVASGWFGQSARSLRQQVLDASGAPLGKRRCTVIAFPRDAAPSPLKAGKTFVNVNQLLRSKDLKGSIEWRSHTGKTWCVVVRVAEEAASHAPIEPAVACTVVVDAPKALVARLIAPELAARRVLVSNRQQLPAVDTASIGSWVNRDPVRCAPNLRHNECCLPPVAVRLVDANDRLSAITADPGGFAPLVTTAFIAPRVELLLEAPQHPRLLDCVRIVGGSYVLLDRIGRGMTRNIVVEVTCDNSFLQQLLSTTGNGSVVVLLRPHYDGVAVQDVPLPLTTLLECQALWSLQTEAAPALQSLPGPVGLKGTSHRSVTLSGNDNTDNAPVAFSHRANGDVAFLRTQLQLIAAFAPHSMMVLHLSAQWKVRLREWDALKKFNVTAHPSTYINPTRLAVPPSRAAHVHACNFKFLLDWGIDFSHVIIWASNELLVRAGIESYVKQFDMSHPGRVDPRDGVAHDNINVPMFWLSDDDHRQHAHRLWEFMPWDGVSQEFAFAALHRRMYNDTTTTSSFYGDVRYPAHQAYLEGAFFSKAVAEDMVRVVSLLQPGTFCTTSGQYANNEIFPFLLSKYRCVGDDDEDDASAPLPSRAVAARCGGRVSTMLWREFFYFGTTVTLAETRCSPFANPFGWKRVKKGLYPLTLELQQLAANATRRTAVRDAPSDCTLTRGAAWQYRERERRRFLERL